jgi:hypothetical protein
MFDVCVLNDLIELPSKILDCFRAFFSVAIEGLYGKMFTSD